VERERAAARKRMASVRAERRDKTTLSPGLSDEAAMELLLQVFSDDGECCTAVDNVAVPVVVDNVAVPVVVDTVSMTVSCVRFWDKDVAPCLPPDIQLVGKGKQIQISTGLKKRREFYWRAMAALQKSSRGRVKDRLYIPGLLYREIASATRVISAAEVCANGDSFTINFVEADGSVNAVRVLFDRSAADAVAAFGPKCVGISQVRVEDVGSMVAWGSHYDKYGKRKRGVSRIQPFAFWEPHSGEQKAKQLEFMNAARPAAVAISKAVRQKAPALAKEFDLARARFPPVREVLGGAELLAEQWANSVDLANCGHIDYERVCYVQWAEDKPGTAKNWFLLFPNVSPCGLAVELTHGVGVSWVGEVHPHCTPLTNLGPHNHTYGMWTGVKNDMWNEYNL
jgi:hypothetical protein